MKAAHPEAVPIAGGTDVMVEINLDHKRPDTVVDLTRIADLAEWATEDGLVRVGAGVTYARIIDELGDRMPGLAMASRTVGSPQIRNRGTVGGSVAHADPAAEMPGIAVTCDAEITVIGAAGPRVIRADDFFIAPLTTALAADEIITEIRLPAWPAQRRWGFREFSRRRGDFAMAAAAVFFDVDDAGKAHNTHIGAIGIGDRPVRLADAEAEVNGKVVDVAVSERAGRAASASVTPQSDIHASGAYRKSLLGTMVERALQSAAGLPCR